MSRDSWRFAAAFFAAVALLGLGTAPAAVADRGGDGSDRGDTQRAMVVKQPGSRLVTRMGETPSGNYPTNYNEKYGDAGSYRFNELTKSGDNGAYIHGSHSHDVTGSGNQRSDDSASYVNGRTLEP